MQKHSSLKRGNSISANGSLWPDCAIEVDPYRLPAHIEFEVPNPVFSSVSVNRMVSIYNSFVVIIDRLGQHSTSLRIVALEDFDAIVVRVGFSSCGYGQIGSAVYLHHEKLGLDLPLYASEDCQETAVFWASWSRVLGVPAMTVGADGALIDPFNRVGKLHVGTALHRRSNICAKATRPVLRRKSAQQQRRMIEAKGSNTRITPGVAAQMNGSNVYSLFGN